MTANTPRFNPGRFNTNIILFVCFYRFNDLSLHYQFNQTTMNNREVIELANKLKNQHSELLGWKVTLNNRKRSFGLCSYNKREIQLSSTLIPYMTDDAIKGTIIHEIAHALCPNHGHDYYWRRVCIHLGGNGERVGGSERFKDGQQGKTQFQKAQSKYTYTCPSCGKETFVNRILKRSCSCAFCSNGKYNEKYKLVITQNY